MGVIFWPGNMPSLAQKLPVDFPQITFTASSRFYWSPKQRTVFYDQAKQDKAADWALLHELSHGLLGHAHYKTDFELLQLEVSAWHKAKQVAESYKIIIDEDHVQDCLDTYRDWLHARSTCPSCTEHGLQRDNAVYYCLNCNNEWRVSSARFCRPYRRLKSKT